MNMSNLDPDDSILPAKTPPVGIPGTPEILDIFSRPSNASSNDEISHAPSEPEKIVVTSVTETDEITEDVQDYNKNNRTVILNILKYLLPFVAIFVLGIFIYYYYFSNFSFSTLIKPKTEVASVSKQKNLNELYSTQKVEFENWIRGFYFDISDPDLLDPNKDLSGNGLTSLEKYILGLNPKVYDTLKNGKADSETLELGINPLTGNFLTSEQKQLIETYIDLSTAVNKKTAYPKETPAMDFSPNRLRGEGNVPILLPVLPTQNLVRGNAEPKQISTSLSALTRQATNTRSGTQVVPTSTPDLPITNRYNKLGIPAVQNYLDIDFNIPGRLEIPSLSLSAPINWPSDPSANDKALETGVIRVPGTADPGSIGTSYISGHSSGYVWAAGDYKRIFSNLNNIPDKASVHVYVTNKQGKIIKLTYVVTSRGDFTPQDPAQFKNTADPTLALGTCWPVGGTAKRKVIFATLDKIERN